MSRLSSSKPPPTPAGYIRLGLQKEEDLGVEVGVGALRPLAYELHLPEGFIAPCGETPGPAGKLDLRVLGRSLASRSQCLLHLHDMGGSQRGAGFQLRPRMRVG